MSDLVKLIDFQPENQPGILGNVQFLWVSTIHGKMYKISILDPGCNINRHVMFTQSQLEDRELVGQEVERQLAEASVDYFNYFARKILGTNHGIEESTTPERESDLRIGHGDDGTGPDKA